MQPTAAQPELDFSTPAPRVDANEVALLCDILRGRGWQSAAEIGAAYFAGQSRVAAVVGQLGDRMPRPWNDRKIRAVAEASDGAVVSYPGSPGYCLLDECPPKQIVHAAAAMQSQGNRMIGRSLALLKRARQLRLVDQPQG